MAAKDHPPLVRAVDTVRQLARIDHSIMAWLGLPFALRDLGLTATPLPCLAGGAKAFRLKSRPNEDDWLATLRALESAARIGLERLHGLERHYRNAQRAIAAEYRPGALPALLALIQFRPLLSPQSVAELLPMSIAGASKLIERASIAGLLVEIDHPTAELASISDSRPRCGFWLSTGEAGAAYQRAPSPSRRSRSCFCLRCIRQGNGRNRQSPHRGALAQFVLPRTSAFEKTSSLSTI